MEPKDQYASFLLRFQRSQHGGHTHWLASTQSTRTGERRWFADLDALVAFLRGEFGDASGAPSDEDSTRFEN